MCDNRNQIIETYKKDLEQYARLRNAIVHEKVEIGFNIIEPNAKVVSHIEKIANVFSRGAPYVQDEICMPRAQHGPTQAPALQPGPLD